MTDMFFDCNAYLSVEKRVDFRLFLFRSFSISAKPSLPDKVFV